MFAKFRRIAFRKRKRFPKFHFLANLETLFKENLELVSRRRVPQRKETDSMKFRLKVWNVAITCRIYFPFSPPTCVCFGGHSTDHTVGGTCNSRGDHVVITIHMRQHSPVGDRLVTNTNASAKSASMLDSHAHMVVWTANVDVPVLKIRLEPRPEPVIR